jgi:hypothetical protein
LRTRHSWQQNVYASLGFTVAIKFCFLNFVQQRGTVTRFENPSRHKHKRWLPFVKKKVTVDLWKMTDF